jgi:hypothetical protein
MNTAQSVHAPSQPKLALWLRHVLKISGQPMIKKVNIDELVDLLLYYRQYGELVNIRLEEETRTVRIGLYVEEDKDKKLTDNDLNQLIG